MSIHLRLLSVFFILVFVSGCAAQPLALRKGNELFKTRNFGEAQGHYEAVLREDSTNTNVLGKLAYCYHMTNKQQKAAVLYEKVVALPKVRAIEYFYFAETLFYLGRYDEATAMVVRFIEEAPEDARGPLLLTACKTAPTIPSLFPNTVIAAANFNTDADENSPAYWGDYLVFSSDRKLGFNPLKQKSGSTGRDYINLYQTKMEVDSFGPVARVDRLNALNLNTSNATFAPEVMRVVYCQNSPILSKQGSNNLQLYTAEYTESGEFRNIELLPFCSPEHNYMHPSISADGTSLYFVSDRSGGQGGTDIYEVHWREKKGWTKADNISALMNTASNEGFPFIAPDGRLFFCSKGHPGLGGYDIFVSHRDTEGFWVQPVNVGAPINSAADDVSLIVDDEGTKGLFTSTRNGDNDDIFIFDLAPSIEVQPVLDNTELAPAAPDTLTPKGLKE